MSPEASSIANADTTRRSPNRIQAVKSNADELWDVVDEWEIPFELRRHIQRDFIRPLWDSCLALDLDTYRPYRIFEGVRKKLPFDEENP